MTLAEMMLLFIQHMVQEVLVVKNMSGNRINYWKSKSNKLCLASRLT
jgi:hypothetical protein